MIELREFIQSDIPVLAKHANNRRVSRYLVDTFPFPYTEADARWWVEEGAAAGGSTNKAILFEGALVGSVGLRPQAGWRRHSAEVGYWIAEPFWGRGIASAALRELSTVAFGALGFHKLFAPVLAPNVASMKVLAKGGYALEGILRDEVIKDGQLFDVLSFARRRAASDGWMR